MSKPNYGLSGALSKDKRTGTVRDGNVSKYSAPMDSCHPLDRWLLYVFKDEEVVQELYLHRKAYFVFGRDEDLADVLTEHPSCSKEHAVVQFRKNKTGEVVPYLIDLESTNGTKLNHEKVANARYIELRDNDVVMFGESSREYVIKKEKPKSASTATAPAAPLAKKSRFE